MNGTSYQVTEWTHPQERMNTQWGVIAYENWCHLEVQRWKDKWRDAWVEANSEGLVAMFTWAEYQRENLE